MKHNSNTEKKVFKALSVSNLRIGILCCTALTSAPALAQQADDGARSAQVEDIVVTAQRRSENLQKVPIAVTAITAERALNEGVTGTVALNTLTPGLQITQTSNFTAVYLRGVGTNLPDPTAEPSVATYIDGVYLSSPQAGIFSFNNIERVEVLKGPQGTLFGRNATGGVIQVITRDPKQTSSAEINVGYGNYDTVTATIYATTGVTQNLAADIAIFYEKESKGFGRNLTLNKAIGKYSNLAVRSKWLWTPTEGTEFRLMADYSKFYTNNAQQFSPGVGTRTYPDGAAAYAGDYNNRSDIEWKVNQASASGALRWDQEIGAVKLFSISSYRKSLHPYQWNLDSDIGPRRIGGSYYTSFFKTFTQEFQLSNNSTGEDFNWSAGIFYFNNLGGYDPWQSVGGGFFWNAKQSTKSWSGYAQATQKFDSGTSVTAGLRYTRDSQEMRAFNVAIPANNSNYSQKASKITWRLAVDQQFSENILGYVSYNRGFKSGGYNLLDVANLNKLPALQREPTYNPEVLDAYEVGFKSDLFDRRLRLNLAAFYYDYQDIQLQQPLAPPASGTRIQNAASATVKGIEGDFEAVVSNHLTFSGGISLLDTKYKNFFPAPATSALGVGSIIDASGNPLVGAPKVSGNIGLQYRADIGENELVATVRASHNGGFAFTPDNRIRQNSYTVINSTVAMKFSDNKYEVRLWGKNLFNEKYFTTKGSLNADIELRAPPRTYGVTLVGRFN